MSILSLIFFHTFPFSLIFLHGIGLERLSMNARSSGVIFPFILRSGALIVIAASISKLFGLYILSAIGLEALTPLCSLMIVYCCEMIINRILKDTGAQSVRERLFAGGTVIFALYHAFSYTELIVIICCALVSMLLWSFILCAIRQRVDESNVDTQWKNAPLLLIGMGIIALTLYAWDIAWIMRVCNFQ